MSSGQLREILSFGKIQSRQSNTGVQLPKQNDLNQRESANFSMPKSFGKNENQVLADFSSPMISGHGGGSGSNNNFANMLGETSKI